MDEQQKRVVSPITLFYSYAHEDELLRNELEKHLSLLHRQGLISEWYDRQILAGDEWAADIDQHLETASIILLLISSDFLASNYCYDIEMKRALERHQRGEARVIPIILRPCDWRTSPFARLQCLPRDGKAITTWQNLDEAFLTVAEELRRVIERQQIPTRPLSHVERQNRTRLMKRVRATWIEGVLEHSLHQAALIALDLQEQPDALANPWNLEVQETNLPPRPLLARTPIVQVYDEADGELLILGQPGAGKTILLLELACALLERAETDERASLPVVFHLSSWAEKRPPLSDWLFEELWTKYQVPRKIGQNWVVSSQILPLLDGLDEVAKDVRSDCVRAINTYHQDRLEQGLAPLVVCCRSKEYMALPTRVHLHQAVSIQPLTDDQIEHYLQSAQGQLQVLQNALHHDSELYELARRPLMLNILTLAYQGATPEDLPTEGTRGAQQRQVFATYVERMLTRRGISKLVSRQQMLQWLTSLAAGMQRHNQTIFYLEYLQVDWLRERHRRLLYRLSLGLFAGLSFGLITGLIGVLIGWLLWLVSGDPAWGPWLGLYIGLGGGLLFGLLTGLLFGLSQIRPKERLAGKWRITKQSIVIVPIGGLLAGLLLGLLFLPQGSFFGLLGGLLAGLVFGLLFGLPASLASGFSTDQLDDRKQLFPNQGIWYSARNGLIVGLIVWMLVGLVAGIIVGLVEYSSTTMLSAALLQGLSALLGFGMVSGLPAGMLSGLGALFQHFSLRFWLWRADSLPWSLIAFLDEAAERLLLRKVGGGYIFIHHLLLDYFTSLETPFPQEASVASAVLQKANENG